MHTRFNRVLAGAAALAVASLALLTSSASALPPGTPAAGAGTLSPSTGTNLSDFTFSPPAGSVCPGDSSVGGGNYRWSTFFVAASVDPATLTYDLGGPVSQGGAYTQPLFTTAGTPVVNRTTALTTGLLTPIPAGFNFVETPLPVPNGAYNIGYACTQGGVTQRFWVTPITISNSTPSGFNYSFGAVPAAPVLAGTLTAGDETLAGTFTHAASVPPTSGYSVVAVPTSGPTVTLPLAAGATSFTLTGLVNGTSYAVTVTATNTAGPSLPSNTVNGTPNPGARPAVTNLQAVPGTGAVALSWVAPAGVAPTGYTIAVSPSVAGSPFTAAAGATSFPVAGLTPGTAYTFTVTPTHPAPYVGTAASVGPVTPTSAQVIVQNISVVRPAGALVLTQRCGVFGALDAEPASPGFSVLPAEAASGGTVGTAPTLTPGGAPDPEFDDYPNPGPATYPTYCGLNLGTAQLVTSGPVAGEYYAASGRMNQVTVLDTRDTDTGWTVNGTASDFTSASLATFSGNALGWTPKVSSTSATQTVTAGANVLPNSPAGLATPKVLASAPSGAGLGIATFDARLKLLIPVGAPSGTYNATLTLTVV